MTAACVEMPVHLRNPMSAGNLLFGRRTVKPGEWTATANRFPAKRRQANASLALQSGKARSLWSYIDDRS